MAEKFTLLPGPTSSSRLNRVVKAAVHLSDGTCVFLATHNFGAGEGPLLYHSGGDHSTPTFIGFPSGFDFGGNAQSLMVCRDSLDNLYVAGPSTANSNRVRVQAFVKGSGYTWTEKSALSGTSNLTAGSLDVVGAVWCNTGGGTGGSGHLLLAVSRQASTPQYGYAICDAGAALAGTGTLVVNQATAPTFLANGGTGPSLARMANVDLSADGFGATSGIAIAPHTNTTLGVGRWAVDSAGALSTNASITAASPISTGTLSLITKTRALRYDTDSWALVYPSPTSAGRYMIARYSSTAEQSAGVDSGAPTDLPLNSAGLSWDAAVVGATVWVFAAASPSFSAMPIYRVGCGIAAGVDWAADAILEDTWASVNTVEFRAVAQPAAGLVDWQAANVRPATSSSSRHLGGSWTQLNTAPTAAVWTTAAGVYDVDEPLPLAWEPTDPDLGDTMSAYALQRDIGGVLRYWRASDSTWQTGEQKNATEDPVVVVPAGWGARSDEDHLYTVKTWDAADEEGVYNDPVTIVASAKVNPAITAPEDASTVTTPNPDLAWDVDEQTARRVRVLDEAGSAVLWTSGKVTTSVPAATVGDAGIEHEGVYQLEVVTWNDDDLASLADVVTVTAEFVPPPTPTLVVDAASNPRRIRVIIGNPAPEGEEPELAGNHVRRRPAGDAGEGIRRARDLAADAVWDEWHAGHLEDFEFRVDAVGVNGVVASSEWSSGGEVLTVFGGDAGADPPVEFFGGSASSTPVATISGGSG